MRVISDKLVLYKIDGDTEIVRGKGEPWVDGHRPLIKSADEPKTKRAASGWEGEPALWSRTPTIQ